MNLAEYFAKNRYRSVYSIGDRLTGEWRGIPFVGSVGNDTVISEIEGPRISIHVDLPIKHDDEWYTVIFVKHSEVRPLL